MYLYFVYPVFVFCLHHGRCECGNVVVVKVQRVGVNQSRFLGAGLSLGASQPEHNWTSHWIQGLEGFPFNCICICVFVYCISIFYWERDKLSIKGNLISLMSFFNHLLEPRLLVFHQNFSRQEQRSIHPMTVAFLDSFLRQQQKTSWRWWWRWWFCFRGFPPRRLTDHPNPQLTTAAPDARPSIYTHCCKTGCFQHHKVLPQDHAL